MITSIFRKDGSIMNVNGVTSQAARSYPEPVADRKEAAAGTTSEATTATTQTTTAPQEGVVYEPSSKTAENATKKTYTRNNELINKLKADAEARTAQLRSLVEKMMLQQSDKIGQATDIWGFLREGKFEVDPATKAQAQADIAEDGYWGVTQTSERILDFANALTGGDPSKLESMRDAFMKGYKMAEKTWGGELPEISRKTYDAVMSGFDKLAQEAGITFGDK